MEVIREWITGITVVAIMGALADALTEKSTQRQVVRMISGVAVLLAVLWPLKSWRTIDLSSLYQETTGGQVAAAAYGQQVNAELSRVYVADTAARYIETQAAAAGTKIIVSITLDGDLMPVSACVTGDERSRGEMTGFVAGILGLNTDRIQWITEDADGNSADNGIFPDDMA